MHPAAGPVLVSATGGETNRNGFQFRLVLPVCRSQSLFSRGAGIKTPVRYGVTVSRCFARVDNAHSASVGVKGFSAAFLPLPARVWRRWRMAVGMRTKTITSFAADRPAPHRTLVK